MGEVIDFKSKDSNFIDTLQANLDLKDNEKLAAQLFSALDLPEEEFSYISEYILNSFEKQLNDSNARLQLIQSLNSEGIKAEDLLTIFSQLEEEINNTFKDKYSPQKITFLKRIIGQLTNTIAETEGIPKRIITVPVELCHEDAKMPQYAKLGDAGMDVYAVEDTEILPGETKIVKTGLKCALPLGYEFEVRPRSGLSLKTPLRVANSPGTIDSGYRDEIGVIITNIEPKIKDIEFDPETGKVTSYEYGQSYTITKGMRFAQLVLKEVPTCSFYEVTDVKSIGIDRESGFGGTGTN